MKPLQSWVSVDPNSDFSIYNLPFGIFKTAQKSARVGVAIGAQIIDLLSLFELGYLSKLNLSKDVFDAQYLNPLIEKGKPTTQALRNRLQELLSHENQELQKNMDHQAKILVKQADAEMLMPVKVGDYTDFYSSIEHATNVGIMFRDPANALLPNWKHLPVGYHGRASSIVVSGTDIYRPKGQTRPDDNAPPVFGPTKQLDFELEMAFITYPGKPLGQSISTQEADDYIFGMLIFNDWSARDIQKWEYVPLGPFLGKNFGSSVSPWVVTLDALEPFRVKGPVQDPPVLPYLQYEGNKNIDIQLQVFIQPENAQPAKVSDSNYKFMYWNMNQQLAHHTVNGCNINAGDLMASGTISGPTPNSYGSMLEIAWKGTKPVVMADGSDRRFIHNGDTVIMQAHCEKDGIRVGFGEVKGKVLPAII